MIVKDKWLCICKLAGLFKLYHNVRVYYNTWKESFNYIGLKSMSSEEDRIDALTLRAKA